MLGRPQALDIHLADAVLLPPEKSEVRWKRGIPVVGVTVHRFTAHGGNDKHKGQHQATRPGKEEEYEEKDMVG